MEPPPSAGSSSAPAATRYWDHVAYAAARACSEAYGGPTSPTGDRGGPAAAQALLEWILAVRAAFVCVRAHAWREGVGRRACVCVRGVGIRVRSQADSPFRAFVRGGGAGAARRFADAVLASRFARVPAGTLVYAQGEEARCFYMVLRGTLAVLHAVAPAAVGVQPAAASAVGGAGSRGGPGGERMGRLGPGDCFGEYDLLTGRARTTSVVALGGVAPPPPPAPSSREGPLPPASSREGGDAGAGADFAAAAVPGAPPGAVEAAGAGSAAVRPKTPPSAHWGPRTSDGGQRRPTRPAGAPAGASPAAPSPPPSASALPPLPPLLAPCN